MASKKSQNPNSLNNLNKDVQSKEFYSEIGKKGGIASGKARREKKEIQSIIRDMLDLPMKANKELDDFRGLDEAKKANLTVAEKLVLEQFKKAANGDTKAFIAILDYAGMQPTKKQEITATVVDSPLTFIMKQLAESDEENNTDDGGNDDETN